jgi:hypothetical protein
MPKVTTCPVCQKDFNVQGASYWPWWKDLFNSMMVVSPSSEVERSATLRCPHCGCTHVSDDYLFFGILNRHQMLWAILAFVLFMSALSLLEV